MTLGVFSADDRTDDAVLMAAVQGGFFGANLPAARIEALIAAHVPRKHIVDVADVYATKWWDYRRLSPGHSFLLFAHHYYKAFKIGARKFLWHYGQTGRNGAGAGAIGVNAIHYTVEEIWDRDAAHITGMWKAMLVCDALGIPYEHFCQLGNQVALDSLWKRLPKPAQLYNDKLGAQILDRWDQLQSDRLITARHPLYTTANYAGLQAQDDYRGYLIEQIKQRADPANALANVVFRAPQLPEDIARDHFPAIMVDRARLRAA